MGEYQKPDHGLLQPLVRRTFCVPDGDMIKVDRFGANLSGFAGMIHIESILQPVRMDPSISTSHQQRNVAQPKSLRLENVHRCSGLGLSFPNSMCSSLKSLHISFARDLQDMAGHPPPLPNWWLKSLLREAVHLKELYVTYEANSDFFLPVSDLLAEVDETAPRAKLQIMELNHVWFQYSDLVSLVRPNRGHLRKLRIEDGRGFHEALWNAFVNLLKLKLPTSGAGHPSIVDQGLRRFLSANGGDSIVVYSQIADLFKEATISWDETQYVFTVTWD